MRTFAHIGIPSEIKRDGSIEVPGAGLFVTDANKSPNKIEWLYFLPDSNMPELLKKSTHIAYTTDDISAEIAGKDILIEPFEPLPGVKAAFIVEEGLPIELMQVM